MSLAPSGTQEVRSPMETHDWGQLTILMYHAVIRALLPVYEWCFVDAAAFRSQMLYVKQRFRVLTLSEAVERLKHGKIDRPTVVLTFDDGFQNNYDVAFPILRDAGIPATVFLTTGLVSTNDTVWFCRLNRALAETRKTSLAWDGCRFALAGLGAKAKVASTIKARLKELPHAQLLTELRTIVLRLGDDPDRPVAVGSTFHMLDRAAIVAMADSGLFEFGAHTHSHAILSLLTPQERHDEIVRSITTVHKLTGRPCTLFAYPNGRAQDYDVGDIAILESCGVRVAVTAIAGPNDSQTSVMELRRYGIGANLSLEGFKEYMPG